MHVYTPSMQERILVTGSSGQIGTELVPELAKKYGQNNIVSLDIREPHISVGMFENIDCQDREAVERIVKENGITQIYHLACILSATGEKMPYKTWEVNMQTLKNVLEIAKSHTLRVFWPSSIAVFGPTTPKYNTPQETVMVPTTMYGITKSAGELLCNYYCYKFDIDIRSVRYPGLISWKQEPGGGTTDYAIDMFYKGIQEGSYESFVSKDTVLPMMYMDDAIAATLALMDADPTNLTVRTSYNLAAISFSVEELAREVQKHIPELHVTYNPDKRQKIADSWPCSIDDSVARRDWGWQHTFDLPTMVTEMTTQLTQKFSLVS
jgi:nucleoside-diphosphate-sugar epimerase